MVFATAKDNSAADQLLTERLRRHVDCLAGLIGPRHLGKPSAFHAAAAYVDRELGRLGNQVVREPYVVDDVNVSNVYIECPGTTAREEVVIVGAHYDTVE